MKETRFDRVEGKTNTRENNLHGNTHTGYLKERTASKEGPKGRENKTSGCVDARNKIKVSHKVWNKQWKRRQVVSMRIVSLVNLPECEH